MIASRFYSGICKQVLCFMKYDILTLVVNAVCILYVRYANCNDGLYGRNRRQKVKQVTTGVCRNIASD